MYGFVVFLLLINGQLLIGGTLDVQKFDNIADGQAAQIREALQNELRNARYLRLAGTASAASFMVGIDPSIFATLVEKLRGAFGSE
jgi:hypothetical protein